MRIAHFSDLHFFSPSWNPLHLFSKRVVGLFNSLFRRRYEFSEELLEGLPELWRELGVDLVLLTGDLTSTSTPEEFRRARAFLEKVSQPWIAIPGNHDAYTRGAWKKGEFYRQIGTERYPLKELRERGVELFEGALGWKIIALDTARPNLWSKGFFTREVEMALRECLGRLGPEERVIVVNHYPFFLNDLPIRSLERGEVLEEIVKGDPRIRMYLHGHTHRHTVADLQRSSLPVVLDSGSATFQRQASWNLIEVDEGGCRVEVFRADGGAFRPVEKRELVWERR